MATTQGEEFVESVKQLPPKAREAAEKAYRDTRAVADEIKEDPHAVAERSADRAGKILDNLASGGYRSETVDTFKKGVGDLKEKISKERESPVGGDFGLSAIGKNAPMFRGGRFSTGFNGNFAQRSNSQFAPSRGRFGLQPAPIRFGTHNFGMQQVPERSSQPAPRQPVVPSGRLGMSYSRGTTPRFVNDGKNHPDVFRSKFKLGLVRKRGR